MLVMVMVVVMVMVMRVGGFEALCLGDVSVTEVELQRTTIRWLRSDRARSCTDKTTLQNSVQWNQSFSGCCPCPTLMPLALLLRDPPTAIDSMSIDACPVVVSHRCHTAFFVI